MSSRVESTPINGLRRIELDLRLDSRGWFAETWQSEKFEDLGLGFFNPLQSNASHNLKAGVTRGIHAEPWSKLVTVTNGSVFSAWVDTRPGQTFGVVHTARLHPGVSYFIPKGVANSYQALEDFTSYIYLVDGLWKQGLTYPALNLFDPELEIDWPISEEYASVSSKDLENPNFEALRKLGPKPTLIFGSGQVAKALQLEFPDSRMISRQEFDLGQVSMRELEGLIPFGSVAINAAAFTRVDQAENPQGHAEAIRVNFEFPKKLARVCKAKSATLIHISSEYVFSGESTDPYSEQDDPSPLSNYGMTKLLGDLMIQHCPHHLLIRTSWVFGDGANFVKTILGLYGQGRELNVVNDQFGRPTSAWEIARFIRFALEYNLDFGTYNLTCSGEQATWFDLATTALDALAFNTSRLKPVSTLEYSSGRALAARPKNGMLNISKVLGTGFTPRDWRTEVVRYVRGADKSSQG